jgi:hypothetical protein
MTQEELFEYNKRCAKFLGFKYLNQSKYWIVYPFDDNSLFSNYGCIKVNNLQFHSDWNWIMEVANAIEKLAVNQDVINWVRQHKCIFDLKLTEAKKEAVVKAINQFLIWYETK